MVGNHLRRQRARLLRRERTEVVVVGLAHVVVARMHVRAAAGFRFGGILGQSCHTTGDFVCKPLNCDAASVPAQGVEG
jgi:hypothetical protein